MLAAEIEFVVFEAGILAGAASEGDDGDQHLGGEEKHPEVHASLKAFVRPCCSDYKLLKLRVSVGLACDGVPFWNGRAIHSGRVHFKTVRATLN
jgi:hypothetical protein